MGYRTILAEELERRRRQDAKFSIRKLAFELELSPSFLSAVFKGRKNLSESWAHKIAERLAFDSLKRRLFTTLVRLEHANTDEARKNIAAEVELLKRQEQLEPLTRKRYAIVAHWYHFAILEMARSSDFALDFAMISKRLKISEMEAELGVQRLLALGLLVEDPKQGLRPAANFAIGTMPSAAIRSHHRQMLKKAMDVLDDCVDGNTNYITGATVAIDPAKLPEAKRLIDQFRRNLAFRLQAGSPQRTYQLGIQLIPLERGREEYRRQPPPPEE